MKDGPKGKRPTPTEMAEKHMERMARELDLTPEQRTKIEAIEKDGMKRRGEFHEAAKADREKIRQVLTPEQQAKWEAMNKERRGHHGPKGAPCCKGKGPAAPCDKAEKPCCKADKGEMPLTPDRK